MQKNKSVITNTATTEVALYNWGEICMLVNADVSPHASFGTVITHPGNNGHELHSHANEDEIIYIVSGNGLYLTDTEKERKVHKGDCIFVPAGVKHATMNHGAVDLKVIIVFTPSGPDKALDNIDGFKNFSKA